MSSDGLSYPMNWTQSITTNSSAPAMRRPSRIPPPKAAANEMAKTLKRALSPRQVGLLPGGGVEVAHRRQETVYVAHEVDMLEVVHQQLA